MWFWRIAGMGSSAGFLCKEPLANQIDISLWAGDRRFCCSNAVEAEQAVSGQRGMRWMVYLRAGETRLGVL